MTITNNITVTSTLLADLSNVETITLKYTDCDSNTTTLNIAKASVSDSSFTSSALSEGVYSFKLILSYNDDTKQAEELCKFIEVDLSCKVRDKFNCDSNLKVEMATNLLIENTNCNCDCTNMCTLYNFIVNALNDCSEC